MASEALNQSSCPAEGGASSIHHVRVIRDGGVYWVTRLRG
jgi:hypothetical protein